MPCEQRMSTGQPQFVLEEGRVRQNYWMSPLNATNCSTQATTWRQIGAQGSRTHKWGRSCTTKQSMGTLEMLETAEQHNWGCKKLNHAHGDPNSAQTGKHPTAHQCPSSEAEPTRTDRGPLGGAAPPPPLQFQPEEGLPRRGGTCATLAGWTRGPRRRGRRGWDRFPERRVKSARIGRESDDLGHRRAEKNDVGRSLRHSSPTPAQSKGTGKSPAEK